MTNCRNCKYFSSLECQKGPNSKIFRRKYSIILLSKLQKPFQNNYLNNKIRRKHFLLNKLKLQHEKDTNKTFIHKIKIQIQWKFSQLEKNVIAQNWIKSKKNQRQPKTITTIINHKMSNYSKFVIWNLIKGRWTTTTVLEINTDTQTAAWTNNYLLKIQFQYWKFKKKIKFTVTTTT